MEINEETYRLFDRNLAGELSAAERADFEKMLLADEQLRNEFDWLNLAVSEIRMNGKSILKKQLAEIGAGIPASAFEKYLPSIKSKSFFKKWWWVITLVVAIGLVTTWFVLNQHSSPEHEGRSEEARKDAGIESKDVQGTIVLRDELDTNVASPFGAPTALIKPDSIWEEFVQSIPGENCRAFSIHAFSQNLTWSGEMRKFGSDANLSNADSVSYPYADVSYGATSETILTVECCLQNSRPAFYTYANRIVLSAEYADTSGLRFFQHGNELMMTDNKPGYFILQKGLAEKPLVRIKQYSIMEGNKDTIKTIISDKIKSTKK